MCVCVCVYIYIYIYIYIVHIDTIMTVLCIDLLIEYLLRAIGNSFIHRFFSSYLNTETLPIRNQLPLM